MNVDGIMKGADNKRLLSENETLKAEVKELDDLKNELDQKEKEHSKRYIDLVATGKELSDALVKNRELESY